MQQLFQHVRSGKTELKNVPVPSLGASRLFVRTRASLISVGIEKMLLDFSKKNLLEKAKARPDLVKQVLDKAKKEFWANTLRLAFNRLDTPTPLGYSAAGIVEQVGRHCGEFSVGDRVAIVGAGFANHAEFNAVPKNLVARIPDTVSFDQAAYTTVCEVYAGGHLAVLDDFRGFDHYSEGKKTAEKLSSQDRGQKSMVKSARKYYVSRGPSPLPLEHILGGMGVIFAAQESLSTGKRVELSL